jgi:hypothetical protein
MQGRGLGGAGARSEPRLARLIGQRESRLSQEERMAHVNRW